MTQQGRTVAVVGGGYGGAAVAKALDEHADVVLIEPKDAFVNAAGSLRALTRPDEWAERIFFPYDGLLKRGSHLREYAANVDARGVTLASGERVEADYIVLATGSGYPYPAKTRTDSTAEAVAHFKESHAELAGAERVLIAGAGPVGLELAGEIRDVWADKRITVVDPAPELLPGYAGELRAELHRQLEALGIEVRLGAAFDAEPDVEPGRAGDVRVGIAGEKVEADIWYRAYGVSVNSGYLGDGLAPLNRRGQLPVTPKLNVDGHTHVYAVGDVTDVAEDKRAGYAMQHAEVVAANIIAQVNGEEPAQEYRPLAIPVVLLPLGPEHGVGQIPSDEGPAMLDAAAVADWKGRDLMYGKFAEIFGVA
ncbi:NAD(P)/FAD-dependent oxidoreductase [Glycomyces albidus]|jgi:NADH dehydrogenase FAD-containing subunit|uniref:FAD-dependent oxidoreductase n=1 Tax=Glycomyces albidus TaxID=2656774 RepID=A0A6L5G8J2_9ACTN|nr:FAD-dependent oxidoreductase [Glycomyces albidus]MQM25940.1 FAD-dependent oxidoreductase [Glycomyces albidus]